MWGQEIKTKATTEKSQEIKAQSTSESILESGAKIVPTPEIERLHHIIFVRDQTIEKLLKDSNTLTTHLANASKAVKLAVTQRNVLLTMLRSAGVDADTIQSVLAEVASNYIEVQDD